MVGLRFFKAVRLVLPALAISSVAGAVGAHALSIELNDVAPDRIERQRAAADGRLPLAGTPDTTHLEVRLTEQGLRSGAPVLMRIFKAQSELEIWMEKEETFVHFATYPICHWSGTLGPKIREGDRQAPEGFYTISSRQLHRLGRWPRAMNLGFPNAFDRVHDRDGSYILMHGGCSSVGCFAMTNPVISEIYGLAAAALRGGQRYIPVHVFPFRMTEENLAPHAASEWASFWRNLKEGYDSFERTHLPPRIGVCENRYTIEDGAARGASEPAAQEGERKKSRGYSMLGAIRETCPEPAVATAEGKSELPDEHRLSTLGEPSPEGRRKRHR
jgi:murein L,D-transpeptidase YafK